MWTCKILRCMGILSGTTFFFALSYTCLAEAYKVVSVYHAKRHLGTSCWYDVVHSMVG